MNERYQRAKKLFLAVCDLSPEEREKAIDHECAGDPELRAEVESLLAHHDAPTAADQTVTDTRRNDAAQQPRRIGPYRILHELGRGGMGVVYLGVRDDDQFTQHVAIKVLKRGMDTDEILRRFKLERQLLAALNHQGIARLYDGGVTDDGLPYFAIEYVEGQPLDEYCDTRRLRIAERLELFRSVCAAVHYAHQNLVVHRDLKPSNILVTKDGVPKLLDFGIAKLISPQPILVGVDPTAPELRIMTPEYASPEQVRGNPITTASDVYSLGVLLYQLVTGHRPYRLPSRIQDEIERVICEVDPEKPSTAVSKIEEGAEEGVTSDGSTTTITPEQVSKVREGRPKRLRRRLAGDIDNIVLMAMRKEPQRRYASVEQFAEDIRHHLQGLPVLARRDTFGYRSIKFIRRHRVGVATAALIAVLLVGGITTTTMAKQDALTERDRAQRMFNEVRTLAHIFMFDFHDAIQKLDGSIPARQLLVESALEYLNRLAPEAGDDQDLQADLADGYDRVGDIRGGIRNPSVGKTGDALEIYKTALAIRQNLSAASRADVELQRKVAISHLKVGDMLRKRGRLPEAIEEYTSMLKIPEAQDGSDSKTRRLMAIALDTLGKVELQEGKLGDAGAKYDRANKILVELVAESPGDRTLERDLSVSCLRVGGLLERTGDHQGALAYYADAVDTRDRLLKVNLENSRARRDLAVAHYVTADALLLLERPQEAMEHIDHCLGVFEQRVKDNPESARARRDLALGHEILGQAKAMMGDPHAALESYRSFQTVAIALWESDRANTDNRGDVAQSHQRVAEALALKDDPAGAIRSYREALRIVSRLAEGKPTDVGLQEMKAEILSALGELFVETEALGEAMESLDSARSSYEKLRTTQPEHAAVRLGLATTLKRLAALTALQGDNPEAAQTALEALRHLQDSTGRPAIKRLRQQLESDLNRYRPAQ